MVVLEVDVLQLGCRGLVRVSRQVCDSKWFDTMWVRKRSWRVAGIDGVQSRGNAEAICGANNTGHYAPAIWLKNYQCDANYY